MLMPAPTWRIVLLLIVTFRTSVHGAVPLWLRGDSMNAKPCWFASHEYSSVLPSIVTSAAFFSSTRFLIVHPWAIHAVGFAIRFRRIVMLLGTRFGMYGSVPPNMMFSAAPSR